MLLIAMLSVPEMMADQENVKKTKTICILDFSPNKIHTITLAFKNENAKFLSLPFIVKHITLLEHLFFDELHNLKCDTQAR